MDIAQLPPNNEEDSPDERLSIDQERHSSTNNVIGNLDINLNLRFRFPKYQLTPKKAILFAIYGLLMTLIAWALHKFGQSELIGDAFWILTNLLQR